MGVALLLYGGWIGAALTATTVAVAVAIGVIRWARGAPERAGALATILRARPIRAARVGDVARAVGTLRVIGEEERRPDDGSACAAFSVAAAGESLHARARDLAVRVGSADGILHGDVSIEACGSGIEHPSAPARLAAWMRERELGDPREAVRVSAVHVGERVVALGRARSIAPREAATYRAASRALELEELDDTPIQIVSVSALRRDLFRALRTPVAVALAALVALQIAVPMASLRSRPARPDPSDDPREMSLGAWIALASPARSAAIAEIDARVRAVIQVNAAPGGEGHRVSIDGIQEVAAALREVSPDCEREAALGAWLLTSRDGADDGCDEHLLAPLIALTVPPRGAASPPPGSLREREVWRALLVAADRVEADRSDVLADPVRACARSAVCDASLVEIALGLELERPWLRTVVAARLARLAVLEAPLDRRFALALADAAQRLAPDADRDAAARVLIDADAAPVDDLDVVARAIERFAIRLEGPPRSRTAAERELLASIERRDRGGDPDPRLFPELRASAARFAGTDLEVAAAGAIVLARAVGRDDAIPRIRRAAAAVAAQRPRGETAHAVRDALAARVGIEASALATPELPGVPVLPPPETVEVARDLCGDPIEAWVRTVRYDVPLCGAPGVELRYLRGRGRAGDVVFLATSGPAPRGRACSRRDVRVRAITDAGGDAHLPSAIVGPASDADLRAGLRAAALAQLAYVRGADGLESLCEEAACRDALASRVRDARTAGAISAVDVGVHGAGTQQSLLAIAPIRGRFDVDAAEPVGALVLEARLGAHAVTVASHELAPEAPASAVYGRPLAAGEIPGAIAVAIEPGDRLEVDGRCVDEERFPVAPGAHALRVIEAASGYDTTIEVVVEPGRTATPAVRRSARERASGP